MHMGHYAAVNIHQLMLAKLTNASDSPVDAVPSPQPLSSSPHKPRFLELDEVPPMIGLAVGKKAVACGPDIGTVSGEDVMHAYFRDDLGLGSKSSISFLTVA
jgi:hypothetical protein